MIHEVENLLKRAMGLDAATIGSANVERAMQERMSVCQLKDASQYWERLQGSQEELQELIEAVVVPETWFFRDTEAFAALVRVVQHEWLPAHNPGTLRLLSLPCSTGEEPYSIAMALLDAGVPPERFHVDAVDISRRAIAHAERGVYGKNSFRAQDLGFRDRHFTAAERGYRLGEQVRAQVRFQHGNMLASGWLPGAHAYDAIFCRNVLIYFDRPTQDRAVQVLDRLLTGAGLLFVGPSESSLLLDHRFVPAGFALAFAFRKPEARMPDRKPRYASRLKHLSAGSGTRAAAPKPSFVSKPDVAVSENKPPLEEAQRLADAGKLVEAMKCCEEHLRRHGPSAGAFYLMGLIHDAAGRASEAVQTYRKALYLDRAHREALAHLALLLEKQGDTAGAEALRSRARRLEPQSG